MLRPAITEITAAAKISVIVETTAAAKISATAIVKTAVVCQGIVAAEIAVRIVGVSSERTTARLIGRGSIGTRRSAAKRRSGVALRRTAIAAADEGVIHPVARRGPEDTAQK